MVASISDPHLRAGEEGGRHRILRQRLVRLVRLRTKRTIRTEDREPSPTLTRCRLPQQSQQVDQAVVNAEANEAYRATTEGDFYDRLGPSLSLGSGSLAGPKMRKVWEDSRPTEE